MYEKDGSAASSTIPMVIQYFVSLVFILYEAGKYPAANTSTQVNIAFAALDQISLVFFEARAFFKYRNLNAVQDTSAIGMVESGAMAMMMPFICSCRNKK